MEDYQCDANFEESSMMVANFASISGWVDLITWKKFLNNKHDISQKIEFSEVPQIFLSKGKNYIRLNKQKIPRRAVNGMQKRWKVQQETFVFVGQMLPPIVHSSLIMLVANGLSLLFAGKEWVFCFLYASQREKCKITWDFIYSTPKTHYNY